MALTQTQLATAVADRAQLSRADAKRALAAFDEVVLDQLGNAEKVRIGGLVQLTVRVRPAQKKRKGRNPATGEEITRLQRTDYLCYCGEGHRDPRRSTSRRSRGEGSTEVTEDG